MIKLLLKYTVWLPGLGALLFGLTLLLQPALAADIIVDQGHGQAFVVEKEGPLDLSRLAAVFTANGGVLRINSEQFTEKILAGADALVISGPFRPFVAREVAAIMAYIEKGGRMCLMLHIPGPAQPLLRKLGVAISITPVTEQENTLGGNPKDFIVKNILPHPITKGLEFFHVYGIWGVFNMQDNAQVIASAGPKSWVDMNGNATLDQGDGVYPYGMIIAGSIGKGQFVVFGDDAIFQNQFFNQENETLGINLAKWLAGVNN